MEKQKNKNKKNHIFNTLISLFKDDYGAQLIFTDTQKEIIKDIFFQDYSRVAIITPTQYGKSTAVACGIILRALFFKEPFANIAGTEEKAKIIGRYIIKHLFDSEIIYSQLEFEQGSLEKLKRERKKEHITFKKGGEIFLFSADYRNSKRIGEILLGKGCKNICIDDSPLISDKLYAYIKRMLGGYKQNFLVETGNPLFNNHFYKTMTLKDNKIKQIWIDYKTALKEGRFTPSFIEEMKIQPYFDVFYECKFASLQTVDEKGFSPLFSNFDCFVDNNKSIDLSKDIIMGVDVGRGNDKSAIVIRNNKLAKVIFAEQIKDLMAFTGVIKTFINNYQVKHYNVFVDDIGVGGGVVDRLREQGINVNPINWGNKSKNEKYYNIKAESFFELKKWLETGGQIAFNDDIREQMYNLKYKINSTGQLIIISKDEMRLLGFNSPDELDALALTFSPQNKVEFDNTYDFIDETLSEIERELKI